MNNRSKLPHIVGVLCALAAVAAPNPRGQNAPAAEFEPVGSSVGWGGLPSRIRHVPTDLILVLIPPGDFKRGSPETEPQRDRDERQRVVTIASAFYLGETEVTVAQWKRHMAELPTEAEHMEDPSLPVEGVSWHKAKDFVALLNKKGAAVWRLPTEDEWEYACRAGTTGPFSFGANITAEQVNYDGGRPYADGRPGLDRGRPVPVRSLPANPWGLYEMHGNLVEWCEDLYVVDPGVATDIVPTDIEGASRVIRGGDFSSQGKQTRSASRDGYPPSSTGTKHGFRLAVSTAAVR